MQPTVCEKMTTLRRERRNVRGVWPRGGGQLADGMIHNDDPERIAAASRAFLGVDYRRERIARIKPRRSAWTKPLAIDGWIPRCAELQERLDAVTGAHVWRLASL